MLAYLKRPLIVAAVAHLALELCANFLPVVYPLLIDDLGLTFAQIGLVALVATVAGSVTQPLFGYLSDRWDPALLVALSVAWIGVCLGLVGFAWSYTSLLIIVGLGVLGSAAFHPPGAMFASLEGGKRRGAALSVFSVGGNLGSAFSPLLVALGLNWLGLPGTGLLIPLGLLIGLMLYRPLKQIEKQRTADGQTARKQALSPAGKGSLAALVALMLAAMTRSWFQVSLVTYLPVRLADQGLSLTAAGQILSVLLFSISAGALIGGLLSDRIGCWQVFVLSVALSLVGYWLFLPATGIAQIVFIMVIGVSLGATYPIAVLMAQDVWPHGVGLASALIMGLGWAPGGLGASVTGWIADQSSLAAGFQSLLPVPAIGLACIVAYVFFLRQLHHQVALEAKNVAQGMS